MQKTNQATLSFEEYQSKVASLKTASDVTNFLKELIAPALQAILEAEMIEHLGYKKHEAKGRNSGNSRNGHSEKVLRTSFGNAPIQVPRDRNADFSPQIIPKHSTIQGDVEEKIIAMYTKIAKLNDEQFRRKTGVKRKTFETMVRIVVEKENARKKILGRPLKLGYEDQVLMSLEYLREYQTYFSLAQIYGISEANTYKICRRVEDILIKSKEFRLPNRKEMYESPDIEFVIVDASESGVERPKKSKGNTTQERKRGIL